MQEPVKRMSNNSGTARFRVLVLPAGTEIGLEIYEALRNCKEVELFGGGQDLSNHGRFVFSSYFNIPSVNSEGWVNSLNDIIINENIEFIIPAHDDVIVALAQNAARINAQIVSSPRETCEVTRSKSRTYEVLESSVRVPRVYPSVEEIDEWPIFAKPDRGQGSQGVMLVKNVADARAALSERPDRILCEYLPGNEYTVDCFSDREEGLKFCGARERIRTRNGISMHSRSVELPEAQKIASAISRILPLHGAWFFQVKRASTGELVLMEVGPRIAGSMAVHRVKGINFPLLSIYEASRIKTRILSIKCDVEIDRSLRNRYRHNIKFRHVYVDLDDTILIRGKVNVDLIRFIFQCHNSNVTVHLITKHRGNLDEIQRRFKLIGLFDEVLHLSVGDHKHLHISNSDSIFIDDSFSERMEVFGALGIPVFDCSMVELLTESLSQLS